MRNIFLVLLILFSCIGTMGQEIGVKKKRIGYRKQMKILARHQITQLKDGYLLIRLHTKKMSIAALRRIGKVDVADKMENIQANYNLEIIAAFKQNFHFCSTYFFYSDYSNSVKDKQFNEVVFLNDSLKPDTAIKFIGQNFLIAEFGTVDQNTSKHHYNYEYVPSPAGQERKPYDYGGASLGFGALIIKSDQFIPLARPFPFYVRTFETIPLKQKPADVVKKMNEQMKEFYIKAKK